MIVSKKCAACGTSWTGNDPTPERCPSCESDIYDIPGVTTPSDQANSAKPGYPSPTLPPITNDVLTDAQLAWWLSHATDPWQTAVGRELVEARRTLAELAEHTRRLLLKTVDDFKASAPKEPTPHE